MKRQVVVKSYKGSQKAANAAFRKDSAKMAAQGYFPSSQAWAQGAYGCGSFLLALILCVILIGILIFIYMVIVKPPGTLTVTYELRVQQSTKDTQIRVVPPPPPGRQQYYRIARNGEDLGEFPASTIKQMITAGQLTLMDYYFDVEANDWMQLECLPALV